MKLYKNTLKLTESIFFKNENGRVTGFYKSIEMEDYNINGISIGYVKYRKEFYV